LCKLQARAKKAISMTPRLALLWLAARAAADDDSSTKEQDYASLKLKPRVVSFNVMVAGLSGLGKTTTCNMLFDAWQGNAPSQEKRKIRRATPHVDVSRKIERYDKRTNTILRVRVVDTPGFGNNIDHKHAVRPITKYIRKCRDEQFRAETGARKETEADGDRLVHACVYFISPHRFLEIDRHFLRHVQRELAIVPVIAKTDTLTDEELAEYRAMLRDEFTKNNIQVYDFGEKSSELLEKRAFARGRERGEPLGIIARDGHYPWGTSQFQFAAHSDFALLKDLLLSEHTEPLIEHASARYARYRAQRVRLGYATDAAKSLAVLALVGRALGLPVPIPSRAGVVAVLKRCGLAAAGLYRKLFVKPEAPPRRRSWFDFSSPPPPPPRRRWMEPLRRRLSPPPAPPPRRRSVAPLFPARALRGAKN